MKRRSFLATGMGAGAGVVAAPAVAQSRAVIRVGSAFAPSADGRGAIFNRLAQRVAGLSGGAIELQLALTSPDDDAALRDALATGSVSAVLATEDLWIADHPAFGLFAACPGGMTERELEAYLRAGNGQDTWNALAESFDRRPHYLGDTGAEYLLSGSEIGSIDAFSGATVATRGLAVELYRSVGANVIVPAVGSVAGGGASMREAGPLADSYANARAGMTRLYTGTLTRPSGAVSLSIGLAAWNGLDAGSQAILSAAAEAEAHIVAAEAMQRNALTSQAFRLSGVTADALPTDVFNAMMNNARDLFDAIESRDELGAVVARSYRDFASDVQTWTRVADAPFVQARRNTIGA
ncbi:MAG: hypothetical protein ACPGID_01335 [Rubricella sp.]